MICWKNQLLGGFGRFGAKLALYFIVLRESHPTTHRSGIVILYSTGSYVMHLFQRTFLALWCLTESDPQVSATQYRKLDENRATC